jgi:hypothetical protein
MAANPTPIYSRVGDIQYVEAIVAANTTKDLTTGTIYLVFTADAANGGRVEEITFTAKGTNVATVARIWINNGATTATAANNNLYREASLPATTLSEVAKLAEVTLALGFALPPGYRIYVTIGTVVAAGYHANVIGGKY